MTANTKEVGHNFLARLGKKRLRPGGIKATSWLIDKAHFSADKKVLEVACNMCTTSIELAQKYGCHITGLDVDKKALEKAQKNIENAGVQNLISLEQGNAMNLPFDDESFDVVINEAMLTMLPIEAKKKAVSEYFRVLKKGGILLTHDVGFENPNLIRDEGFFGALKIMRNGMRKENREMFQSMRKFFNHTGRDLKYIAVASRK